MKNSLVVVASGLLLSVLLIACAHTIPAGSVSFRVESNVPDATLWIDDILVGKASDWSREGKFVRAGFHRIEVRHPKYYSFFQEVELLPGSQTLVKAHLRELLE